MMSKKNDGTSGHSPDRLDIHIRMDDLIRTMKPSSSFEDFVDLVEVLRNRCPWDQKQTHQSLKDHLIEEAYEAVDAIESEDSTELSKELGDLLLQVVFHSRMAHEKNHFTIEDVIWRISEKLIRRHPHIFADTEVNSVEDVSKNWESIKMGEGRRSVLDGLPVQLPALIRAHRMQEKASNVGFDWGDWKPAFDKVKEELQELEDALESSVSDISGRGADDNLEISLGDVNPGEASLTNRNLREEFGDLFFSLVNVARLMGFQSEELVREAGRKFERRFRAVESELEQRGSSVRESTLEEMDKLWDRSKRIE